MKRLLDLYGEPQRKGMKRGDMLKTKQGMTYLAPQLAPRADNVRIYQAGREEGIAQMCATCNGNQLRSWEEEIDVRIKCLLKARHTPYSQGPRALVESWCYSG